MDSTSLPEAIETRLTAHTGSALYGSRGSRNSLKYVSYKHRKEVAADLKLIYSASTEAEAQIYLDLFAEKWDRYYPSISKLWHARLLSRDPVVCFSSRHSASVIYPTNAIESVNMTLGHP